MTVIPDKLAQELVFQGKRIRRDIEAYNKRAEKTAEKRIAAGKKPLQKEEIPNWVLDLEAVLDNEGRTEYVRHVGDISEEELKMFGALRRRIAEKVAPEAIMALRQLVSFVPECGYADEEVQKAYQANGAKPGENPPLFCEVTLYQLLGKMDGRTVLAMLDNVCSAFGYEYQQLYRHPKNNDL